MDTTGPSQEFVWKRLHSLMGLWLVLFLIEHLFVNSQAALLLGENGKSFIESVNAIHNLPYLPFIEISLLGIPILIHIVWGIRILLTSKSNAFSSDGAKPLIKTKRNQAYLWQRLTSWILLIGLCVHVVEMRFLDYPWSVMQGQTTSYFVKIRTDKELFDLTHRLGFTIYGADDVAEEKKNMSQDKIAWVEALAKEPLEHNEVIAVTDTFGTASLLTVRDTFKDPFYVGLYTLFVLAACFHGFNGFWTFLLTWGLIIKIVSQKRAAKVALGLMLLVSFLGLAAIWGTYLSL